MDAYKLEPNIFQNRSLTATDVQVDMSDMDEKLWGGGGGCL